MQIEREIYFQKLASRIFLVLIKLHFILSLIKVLLKYKAEKKELSVHSCKALLLLYQKKSSGAKIGFSSKMQPFKLVITSNDKIENAIKIGPVLEKVNRKKSESTLLDVYKRFYKVFDTTSKERLVQSDAKRVVNVHTVTSAEIQFQLLSNNIGQPATIDENAEKVATFVLYNHARIVQILHASKEISAKNQQCAENTVIHFIGPII